LIPSGRVIRKQAISTVPVDVAWQAWTTAEGVSSFFAPKANVESRVGGAYELFFDLKEPRGFQGTEGCKLLEFNPMRNLAFEFAAPPQFPNARRVRSRVDVLLEEPLKGGVLKIDLTHSGFMEGEEWDECYDFFSWSWDLVLGRFQYRCSVRPVDWTNPFMPRGIAARPQRKLRDHVPS